MKKLFTLFAVAAMAFAAQANVLTVCDGESWYAGSVPVYGLWADTEGTMGQMIYPEWMLTEMVGSEITEVQFYTAAAWLMDQGYDMDTYNYSDYPSYYVNFDGATVQLSLMTVDQNGFEEAVAVVGATPVATVVPESGDMYMTFVLDEPFAYNGGNLLVEAKIIETQGDYGTSYFIGASDILDGVTYSYYAYQGYSSYNEDILDFLPMVTFTYGEGSEQPTERTDSPSASKVNYVEHEGDSYYNAYTVTLTPAETEPDCVIWYRIGVMEDGEYVFGPWMEYVAPFDVDDPGSYRIEAYAITEGKLESYPIADEFVVSKLTDVEELFAGKTVANVRYFNVAGQEMQQANGLTIMVTTFTDGTQSTVKVVK